MSFLLHRLRCSGGLPRLFLFSLITSQNFTSTFELHILSIFLFDLSLEREVKKIAQF